MPWIKVDDQMPEHPKVEPLSDAAFRWIFRGLSYANRYLTNGVLHPVFLAKVPEGVREELRKVQDGQKNPIWKTGSDGKVRIHGYRDYQPTKAEVEKVRKGSRDRQARFRDRLREAAERAAAGSHGETSRESNTVTNDTPSRPVPTPTRRTRKSPLPPSKEGGGSRPPRLSTRKPNGKEQQWVEGYLRSIGGCPHHEDRCRTAGECQGRLVMWKREQIRDGMWKQAEGAV